MKKDATVWPSPEFSLLETEAKDWAGGEEIPSGAREMMSSATFPFCDVFCVNVGKYNLH